MLAVFALFISSCGEEIRYESQPDYGIFTDIDYLKAVNKVVQNKNYDTVNLRGVNAGGLFVTEHWMTGFEYGSTPLDDYRSLTKTLISRFGEVKTKKLWNSYRNSWWTEADFKNCADMGMNVIRLPFSYMNVDFDAVTSYENAGRNYNFAYLDDFVSRAAHYGIYTILDLHGAYGSQNGQDHSGEIKDSASEVDFYSNGQMQDLTVRLWKALSNHFKDNPAVAGYDILNEPGEKAGVTSKPHWDFYDKAYKAIRENGDGHIVIFESCWDGRNLPHPSEYGWENCIYSFHHYSGADISVNEHMTSWEKKIKDVEEQNFGVPLQMGEFTNYASTEKWERTLQLLNDHGWHWSSWTYKVWNSQPWGIYNVSASGVKVNVATDPYEVMTQKFSAVNTALARKYTFKDSGKTLEEIMKAYLT